MSQHRPRWAPRPLGTDSLLWRYAGDHRLALTGLSAGILQLMHPGIGAGVAQHSNFFEDPWDRILRSAPQILGVVYGPEPEVVGRRVRDYHRSIRGVDHLGRTYSALDPATFWWAHATFQYSVEKVVDRFDARRLRPGEREELYRDGVEWYRRYGVTMRPVPRDYGEYRTEWKRICREVLEMTPAAERAVEMALRNRSLGAPFLPWWTKPLQPFVVTPILQLTAIGGLPDPVRRRFGIPWRIDQEVEYRTMQVAVREWFRWLPEGLRYGPVAASARKRVAEAIKQNAGPADRAGAA
ncbi:MAG TPA: oxygenase MpaB family protein [Acidimicrobiales bacterium]|nr:oxygenase MpaB family protein [Acidimicrobiales bacterium]